MITCKRVTEKEGTSNMLDVMIRHKPKSGLTWHRGRQAGIIDAILTLQEMEFKIPAEVLQKHFDMNNDGSIYVE